jgi:hypothetical protein
LEDTTPMRRRGSGEVIQMRNQPITVEIITYAPTEFFHCTHCEVVFQQVGVGQKVHAEQREANLPADLREEFRQLSTWVEDTAARHPDSIQFKIVDAASLEGVFKTLRHGLRRFPTIVIDGNVKIAGDLSAASSALERRLQVPTG